MNREGLVGPVRKALVLIVACILIPACNKAPAKPPPTIPDAPTGLAATAQTTSRIDLTWTDASTNEAEFRIWRSTAPGGPFVKIGSTLAGATVYSDRGLLPGTQYFYQVTAWNGAGDSTPAGPMNDTTKQLSFTAGDMTNGPAMGLGNHSAIFDSANQKMVVFGGIDDFLTVYSDTLLFDLSVDPPGPWSPTTVTGTAPFLYAHSAIYDSLHQRMVVFGGIDDTYSYTNKVYILDLNSFTWSTPSIAGAPPSKRGYHTAVYDGANQRMIVFGGIDGTFDLQDAFTLSLPGAGPLTWAPVMTAGPLKRSEHAAIVDPLRSRMIIFGGHDSDGATDGSIFNHDSWALVTNGLLNWIPLTFPGTPSLRAGHSGVYDSANQRMVIFGGGTSSPTLLNDLWAMRLDVQPVWSVLTPTVGTAPAGRKWHSAVYDPVWKRMVIYGGVDGGLTAFNEVWVVGL